MGSSKYDKYERVEIKQMWDWRIGGDFWDISYFLYCMTDRCAQKRRVECQIFHYILQYVGSLQTTIALSAIAMILKR